MDFSDFRPLMTAGLKLKKKLLTLSAKSTLIPLALSTGMSAADADFQN